MTYLHIILWLCCYYFGIWCVSGSKEIYKRKEHHGLNDLVRDFSNIIQKPTVEYIDLNLEHEDAFDREATGVYKLIPYYMKIYPKDTNHGDRFIIQQNPFNDEFQLIKIFNYIYRKNVRSLFHPNKEILQKKDLTKIHSFQKYQTNVKVLAEKNTKLESKTISQIEEIEKMKNDNINLKENLETKTKYCDKTIKHEKEIFEKILKEKEFKIEEDFFQLKLQNLENEQKIYDLQKTLEAKEFVINDQKQIIEKLKIQTDFKYKEENLQEEISNLKHEIKTIKQNLKQEKNKNKESEKEKKQIMKKTLNQFAELQTIHNEIYKYKINYEEIITLLERHYYYFSTIVDGDFCSISQIDKKFRLKKFLCDLEAFKNDQNFDYERYLINYGTFMYVERIRIAGMIHIEQEKIFDPRKLALPICTDYDIQTNITQMQDSILTKIF